VRPELAIAPSPGFTLLEVAVALAILSIGLVAVVDINAGAARLHEESQHLTVGTLLARSKMIDLEQKLNEDGFSDFDQQIDGTFEEQGHPEIRWHAEILKPDTTKANDQLTQLITGAMAGGGGANTGGASGGGLGGGLSSLLSGSSLFPQGSQLPSALSGLNLPGTNSSPDDPSNPTTTGLGGLLGGAATGIIQAQVTQLVSLIQSGIREVRLTVTWPDGAREDSLSVATHLVVLNALGSGVSNSNGAPAGQGSQTGSTSGNSGSGSTTTNTPATGSLGGSSLPSLGNLH
jgi:general secretion pathway protein I